MRGKHKEKKESHRARSAANLFDWLAISGIIEVETKLYHAWNGKAKGKGCSAGALLQGVVNVVGVGLKGLQDEIKGALCLQCEVKQIFI